MAVVKVSKLQLQQTRFVLPVSHHWQACQRWSRISFESALAFIFLEPGSWCQPQGSMCCRPAKDGINTLGVKHRVNPGVQLVRVSSQHLSMIGLRNTVEASLKQPEQRLRLTLSFTFSSPSCAPVRVPAP